MREINRIVFHFTLLVVCIPFVIGCKPKEPEVEGYRVVSFDQPTGRWVIIRNGTFDGKYLIKKLTVVCSSFKWGERPPVRGIKACNLRVGRMMVLSLGGDKPLTVIENGSDSLSIFEGKGDDKVEQHFVVLSQEIVNE